jgi:hypothetical protein
MNTANPPDEPAAPSPCGHLTLADICADFARRERLLRSAAARAGLSRRAFLHAAAAAVAGGAVASRARAEQGAAAAPSGGRSRVVIVTHPEVIIRDYRVNPPIVRQMLDRAVAELAGSRTPREAWAAFGREGDFVAIKHNSIGSPTLHSHTEINDVVASQLAEAAGVDPARILAVDRRIPPPYNELSDPLTIPSTGLVTRLRRLYADQATAIVNVSVLKCHFGDGISAALKNHLGSVNNPAAFHGWEPGRMPLSLPELNALPPLRTKTRLCIVDAVRPLFAGGPADDPQYRYVFNGLIVTADPVAATAVGMRLLEEQRAKVRGRPWPMDAARAMVAHGQQIGLGAADPDRIDLVRVNMG